MVCMKRIASALSLLGGALVLVWSLYTWVFALYGDSRERYSGTGPEPSAWDGIFTPGNLAYLGAGLVFGALLIAAFWGLRREEPSVRWVWAVVAFAAGIPPMFGLGGFYGGALGIFAGFVGLVDAWRSTPRASRPAP